jgi:hypothetical protein
MKKPFKNFTLLLSFFLLIVFSLEAQVKFEEFSSLDKLLSKAKKDKKLIFIQVESDNCDQCNSVAQKGLSGVILKEKFEVNFISTLIKQDHELFKEILAKTNIQQLEMGSIFLDADGYLLSKVSSTVSSSPFYVDYADKAIALSKNNLIKELDAQYQKGERSKTLLVKLIQEKNKADFDTHFLMEEYIDLCNFKELATLENAKLIIEQGMPLESRGRKLLYSLFSNKTIDSLFLTYSLKERIKINRIIISSTRNIALRNKDKNLGMQLSNFISRTYDNNWEKGNFHRQSFLVNFYKDLKDTSSFLQNAESFCNYSLMSLSVDTLKKRDDYEHNKVFEQNKKLQNGNSTMSFSYTQFYLSYARELNNIAYGVFTFSNDLEKLAKALKWTKRAMEIEDALIKDESRKQNPETMDTYACLLYRLGKKDAALDWETKALNILKSNGQITTKIETTLNKIKNGTL